MFYMHAYSYVVYLLYKHVCVQGLHAARMPEQRYQFRVRLCHLLRPRVHGTGAGRGHRRCGRVR